MYFFVYCQGTRKVQGMSLETREFKNNKQVGPLVFQTMYNLKYLKFVDRGNNCKFSQGVRFLPDELRYLNWYDYPSKCLPQDFMPQNLVELHLPFSQLENLWSGTPVCFNLC